MGLSDYQHRVLRSIESGKPSALALGAIEGLALGAHRLALTDDEQARVERAVAKARATTPTRST